MYDTRSKTKAQELPDLPPTPEDELFPIKPPTTLGFKLFFIFPVAFVWLVAPTFCSISLQHLYRFRQFAPLPSQHAFYKLMVWVGHAEVLFQLFFQYSCWRAQARKTYPVSDQETMRNLLLQCMSVGVPVDHPPGRRPKQVEQPDWSRASDDEVAAIRRKLRAWFYHAPMSSIKADNIREWLAWALAGGRTLEDAKKDPEAWKTVEEGFNMTQKRLRATFKEGYNPKVKALRLTLDPVRVLTRPLGYYCVTNAVTIVTYIWLVAMHGFRFQSRHGSQLLVKRPTRHSTKGGLANGHAKHHLPLVFLHGLGIGIGQYMAFLKHIADWPEGVVILLQPNISTQIFHPAFLDPPPKEAYVAAVVEACKSIGVEKATIVSHSNGTMVHGWMLRGCPELCERNILVDAVCFRLWEGDVCFAFLRRRWRTGLELLLGYFVARELGTAHSISRDFQWTDMLLWEHELPSVEPDRFRCIVGSADILIDSSTAVKYLKECGVPDESVFKIPNTNHGQALCTNGKGMEKVLEFL